MKRLVPLMILLTLFSCGHSVAQEHVGMRDGTVIIVDTLSRKDMDDLYKKIQSKIDSRTAGSWQDEREIIYPWADCASHLEELESYNVLVTEMRCDKCGKRIVIIPFKSPEWTWGHLCGREGELYICPSCMRQVRFDCWKMN